MRPPRVAARWPRPAPAIPYHSPLVPAASGSRKMRLMPGRSRIDAVLFDLWGTLVAPGVVERDVVGAEMARDLSVDPAAFVGRLIQEERS